MTFRHQKGHFVPEDKLIEEYLKQPDVEREKVPFLCWLKGKGFAVLPNPKCQ